MDKFNRDGSYFAGPPKRDRSAAMSELAHLGAEMGWADEQIATVLYDADDRWGKYKFRRDRERRITDFINRARQKHGYNSLENVDLARMIQSANQTAPVMGESKLIYGYQDFVDAEFKIEWILSGLLAQGGFGLITGYPGTGKTQFSIALGAHMALGNKKFLTWDNVAGKKKVLFLSLEMSAAPLNLFMGTIGKAYDDKNTLNRNFLVAPFGTPINLDTPEGQIFFDQIMNDHMPDILVIDSLQKISSKELTDEQAVKNLIHYLSVVRAKYSCAMLMIHHNRKKPNDGQKKGVELSDVYGSTYITTDVDFVVSLKTVEGNLLQVDTLKNRLGPTFDAFTITRNPDNLSFSTDLGNIFNQFAKDNDIAL
jgi:archaellum biogenesis ATPase FlaH